MSDLEYLKLAHEVKDAKDIADIDRYINTLKYLIQQGRYCVFLQAVGWN